MFKDDLISGYSKWPFKYSKYICYLFTEENVTCTKLFGVWLASSKGSNAEILKIKNKTKNMNDKCLKML